MKYPEVVYRKKPMRPQVQHQQPNTPYLGSSKTKVVVVDPKTGLVKRVRVGPE